MNCWVAWKLAHRVEGGYAFGNRGIALPVYRAVVLVEHVVFGRSRHPDFAGLRGVAQHPHSARLNPERDLARRPRHVERAHAVVAGGSGVRKLPAGCHAHRVGQALALAHVAVQQRLATQPGDSACELAGLGEGRASQQRGEPEADEFHRINCGVRAP